MDAEQLGVSSAGLQCFHLEEKDGLLSSSIEIWSLEYRF